MILQQRVSYFGNNLRTLVQEKQHILCQLNTFRYSMLPTVNLASVSNGHNHKVFIDNHQSSIMRQRTSIINPALVRNLNGNFSQTLLYKYNTTNEYRNINSKLTHKLFYSFNTTNVNQQNPETVTYEEYVTAGKEHFVGLWLLITAAAVLSMIILGGYTRLTHSGLSMTDWKPYTGRAPTTPEQWESEFCKYKQCIEYQTVNKNITIEQFKSIYYLEYYHRLLGSTLGVLFTGPFVGFMITGWIKPKLRNRLGMLLILGGMQGLIGWWMVKSGLKEQASYQTRPRVSPYRLAIHFMMATTLYAGLLWHSFLLLLPSQELLHYGHHSQYHRSLRLLGIIMLKCLLLNMLTGSFVAGIDAGKIYNTWPLMNGQIVPSGVDSLKPFWKNFVENKAMVQFNHRNMAYITVLVSWRVLYVVMKSRIGGMATVAALLAVSLVNYQALSGIITLLGLAERKKASMHQMTAMVTFTSVLLMIFLARGRGRKVVNAL